MGLLSHLAALSCIALTAYAAYSDSFARNKMLPLSAAAYSDHPQECLKNTFSSAQVGEYAVPIQCNVYDAPETGFTEFTGYPLLKASSIGGTT